MRIICGAAALAAGLLATAATAQTGAGSGVLECRTEGGVGFVVGSTKQLECLYRTNDGATPERYEGRIRRIGLDVGVTGPGILTWGVIAPTNVKLGSLEGRYVGGSAEASAAVGAGANVLVGGSQDTISLQPMSVQGQTGLNVAAGISELELVAVP